MVVGSLYAISSGAMPPTDNIGCTSALSLEEILEFEFHLSSTKSLSFIPVPGAGKRYQLES